MLFRQPWIWVWILCLVAVTGRAESAAVDEPVADNAQQVVLATSQQVMAVVKAAESYFKEDPDRFYRSIQEILDPVIDYRGFARSVMGPYATSDRYRSLDTEGREQLRNQLDQFTEVMRLGLVRTYGKGLLAFGGSRIEVLEVAPDDGPASRATVRQLIYSNSAEPHELLYQMARDKSGTWTLRNVVFENVNLGEIYRNQFKAAARQFDGDLNAVIANWTAVEVET